MPFGALLRQLRSEAGLTQEELAEAASLSTRSVSDLERGINLTARKDTARLLADALNLAGPARAAFEAAARGRVLAEGPSVGGVAKAMRTLPRDISSFTGREPELRQLVGSVSSGVVGIHAIGGMAGIGKTAFAVHAAHQLAPRFPDGQIFLPLHGHTPGQQPVNPADALASLLLTAGVSAQQIPPDLEARMALWRDRLAGKQVLLLLDDAADSEQVQPLLPGSARSLVLITSRRHLTALDDAQAVSLDILPAGEAAAMLARLASRPGLSPTDAAVDEIARLCGYLPLALGMIARQLHHHPAWAAAELAAELAAARDRLELMVTENLSVAAAFNLSYRDLSPAQQRLFHRLGLHPGTDIDAYAAAALDGIGLAAARQSLAALYDQYLLAEPARGRYRLHDLIREHARALAATDPAADSDTSFGRLLDYYLHTARTADRYFALRTRAAAPAVAVIPPAHAPDLLTREQAGSWLEAERLNLHAVAGHAAAHGKPGHCAAIPAAMHGFLYQQGHWGEGLALHNAAIEAARDTADPRAEADALTDLGDLQRMVGDRRAARVSLDQALALYRQHGDQPGEGNALNRLGLVQYHTDELAAAGDSYSRALELHVRLGDPLGQAHSLRHLGAVQLATGTYRAAIASLTQALDLERSLGSRMGEAKTLTELGAAQRLTGDYGAAIASLTRALELCRQLGDRVVQADTLNQLGTVLRLTGDCLAAAASHQQALELSLDLHYRLGQANALNLLGAAQLATGDHRPAATSAEQALHLYRDIGDREGEAEVLNNLGDLALASAAPAEARARHQQALTVASAIPLPLEQARALEGIGRAYLQDGHPGQAAGPLRQALETYRLIRSPHAQRIETTLRSYGI